ncbi:MAG: sensor histidine kinase [Dehalococcoidia bacterium]
MLEAIPVDNPLPIQWIVLFVVLIPASFAYTILRNQLWGIRRLVHRGLVYLLLSSLVFGMVVAGVAATDQFFRADIPHSPVEIVVLALILLAGIFSYHPVKNLVRKAVDRLMYGGAISYPEFIQGLQRDLTSADPESDLPFAISQVFLDRLSLESVLLLRRDEDDSLVVVTQAGGRSDRVMEAVGNGHIRLALQERLDGPTVLPYEGEQVLGMQLWASDSMVGVLLLGPKQGGELFVQDEINLIVNAAPFMATALERHELSKTMRQLNRRLVETEEQSRQRMAIDLHDGPLQKAVALAIGRIQDPAEQKEVATELVNELREIGSRLRPSILDDLGLPASLEWLLDHNMRGTTIRGSLALEGMDEDTRLAPDVELALFRITQEAINNAVKHSGASELRVTLSMEEEQITLTIQDNGVGVGGSQSSTIESSRLGLVGMRERAMQVNGHLEMHSRPNEGVFIQTTVPVEATEPV